MPNVREDDQFRRWSGRPRPGLLFRHRFECAVAEFRAVNLARFCAIDDRLRDQLSDGVAPIHKVQGCQRRFERSRYFGYLARIEHIRVQHAPDRHPSPPLELSPAAIMKWRGMSTNNIS